MQGTRSDLAGRPRTRRFEPRIPEELYERLRAEADRRQVSLAYLCTKAIERLLDDIEGKELL